MRIAYHGSTQILSPRMSSPLCNLTQPPAQSPDRNFISSPASLYALEQAENTRKGMDGIENRLPPSNGQGPGPLFEQTSASTAPVLRRADNPGHAGTAPCPRGRWRWRWLHLEQIEQLWLAECSPSWGYMRCYVRVSTFYRMLCCRMPWPGYTHERLSTRTHNLSLSLSPSLSHPRAQSSNCPTRAPASRASRRRVGEGGTARIGAEKGLWDRAEREKLGSAGKILSRAATLRVHRE